VTQIDQSEGVLAEGQARLAGVRVFNLATAGAVEFFQLFDQDTPPAAAAKAYEVSQINAAATLRVRVRSTARRARKAR
jgi:hypothetical protein